MQELIRTQGDKQSEPTLVLGIAQTDAEIESIQRLRYEVYTQDMGAHFPEAKDGIDRDRYDPYCQHLMVCDVKTGRIVGTYRVMTPEAAKSAGGYYAESEFDLEPLKPIMHKMCEGGRSCTHPDYRGGGAIMLLWAGLAHFMKTYQCPYMLGCASSTLADGGIQAANVWAYVRQKMQQNPNQAWLKPRNPYPIEDLEKHLSHAHNTRKIPPLIKGYMKLGGHLCGFPAWDKDFNAADFPVLIDAQTMEPRYQKHFGLENLK